MHQPGEDLAGRRVLVTGACGFIGPNLIRALQSVGAVTTAADLIDAAWSRLPDNVARVEIDLLDPESLTALPETEIVFHLAARTDLDGRTAADYGINSVGTRNLIQAVRSSGAVLRFVHYSTQLVVGLFDEARFIDESEPFRTKTPYGESKIESEKIVADECGSRGIEYTIIRPTSVYGPWGGPPYREFFQTVRAGRYMHVGAADNLISLVYVENLVDLTLLLSTHPQAAGETFFGNDLHPYTMREVVDAAAAHYEVHIRRAPVWLLQIAAYGLGVLKVLGLNVPLYPFRLRNMRMTYCYDVSKSVRLGYAPRFGLQDGIEKTLDWYDAHPAF